MQAPEKVAGREVMPLEPFFDRALVIRKNSVDLVPGVEPELPIEQSGHDLLDPFELPFVQLAVERACSVVRIRQF